MTPSPQEIISNPNDGATPSKPNSERVVVTGMSGLYPQSRNIKEFSNLLYKKINPITIDDQRWKFTHPEISNYVGKISGLNRFDAQFFKVHYRQGNSMDPMSRKLLELAYEAIYDAGVNPAELNEKKVGVFIAAGLSESERMGCFNNKSRAGFSITGCSKTMYANRISYWLNAKGPSATIDSACCGSMVALEQAIEALNRGDCETALVGGSNICLLPQTLVNFNRCITIAADGKTKCFAENANGCAKSDAINMLFLQKARDALRIYGEVINVKNEFISQISDETGQVFGFNRDLNSYTSFLKQFYDRVNVAPEAVQYVEAFGSASPEADKTELQAIENVFCQNRSDPLLVGSVMSNVGFTDAASGFTAITKVLLGYHKGEIASNLHCERPRQDVVALREGRMQIVTDNKPITSTYIAVNGLSVTGINSHVLLHGQFQPKDYSRYKSTIPRLVTISTRQDSSLPKIFEDLKSRRIDPEEIALLHNIHANAIPSHLGRGYIILDTDEEQKTKSLAEKAEYVDDTHRPLWFVYSGMGSQWTGMGVHLMRIPIFAAAVERCRKVLEPLGIDIVNILTSTNTATFDNIQNSFMGIAVVQIGLTDVLKELGLKPDKIIGHSVGELACAYADGCLSAEEMIIAAYCRGRVSLETKFIRGAMAAVGLGNNKMSKICPPEIEVACHNGPDSCTISGPADKITEFVGKLTADGIFAKEVPCSNIAYHSRYIAPAGPKLLEYLSNLIKNPKPRSDKWVSTSVPQSQWNEPKAKLCSAEYLTNNLLSPVLFEETCQLVPDNAVLVEIAPHGLLQAILKRSLSENCTNIALTKRGHSDNAVFLLNAIGQLYIEGFSPQVHALYPRVQFPVSTGTPHLSHYVEWMHSESWYVPSHVNTSIRKAASCNFLINLHEDEYSYLKGNVIRGKVKYPFAAALVAAWDTLAMTVGSYKKEVSVQFREVHLYSQPLMHDQRQLRLSVSLHRGNGQFDILHGSSKVASGYISTVDLDDTSSDCTNQSTKFLNIGSEEVYNNLRSRGYDYGDAFRSIHKVDENITEAELLWNDNWEVLIDGMLQLNILRHPYSGITQPSQIRELTIDVDKHFKSYNNKSTTSRMIEARLDSTLDSTACGGIVLKNIKLHNMALQTAADAITLEVVVPTALGVKRVNELENEVAINKCEYGKPLELEISNVGDFNTLEWKEAGISPTTGVKVEVHYAGLNMSDIKKATGVIPFENNKNRFGMEFSGLTKSGDRVMGLVKYGAVSTVVTAHPDLLWPVPAYWSLEDAATVPLAYAQALYCLKIKNELERNSKVLIHGGAGALGQAAISIALAMGCQIFTTVSDQSKKRFLQKLFPQLRADYIGNSRDSSFADIVMTATNGEGCDLILSCVKGDLRNECLKCTAHMGTMVDTSLLQSGEEFVYRMSYMTKSRSFMAVDFKTIFEPENYTDAKRIRLMVSEGISQGYVRPLSRVTYTPDQAPCAFHLLAASRHRGRVLLRLRDQQQRTKPRLNCTPNHCQIIFCDSETGLQMVDRLVDRGANKLRIHCFDESIRHNLKIRSWKNLGVNVIPSFGKVLTYDEILKFLKESEVQGIHVIISNKNNNFDELTSFVNDVDKAARDSCPLLKYFAVASTEHGIGKETCISRSTNHLPATTIVIPDLSKVNKEYNLTIDVSTWNRIVVDVIERALQTAYPVLIAKPHRLQQLSLLQQLGNIAGIGNLFSFDDNTTLKDLNIENEDLNMIKLYLHDTYSITLEDEEIPLLTKNKIREIELSATGVRFSDVKGLSTFFSYVDDDELRGTTSLVLMDTLVTSVVGDELDLNETYLTIVPGMEGHHQRFLSMCNSLKIQAVVLQPGLDFLNETPDELAQRYSEVLLNKLGVKDTFYLLGYESGVTAALKLAAILEAHGKTGIVFCVGDDPDGIRARVEEQLTAFSTEEALQAEIIAHMFELMSVKDTTLLDKALQGCCNWDERATACVNLLLGQVAHSAQYARAVLDAAYVRITTTRNYRLKPIKLISKIVVLRAKSSDSSTDTTLQQFSEQIVSIHELAAPLAHATKDLRCAAIVNRYLSKDLLKSYASSNLCISYNVEM